MPLVLSSCTTFSDHVHFVCAKPHSNATLRTVVHDFCLTPPNASLRVVCRVTQVFSFRGDHDCIAHLPYFWNSQSLLSSWQTCLVFNHLEMQWKWKACCLCRVSSNRRGPTNYLHLHCKYPRQQCTLHWSRNLDWLDIRCL
jgi:hypothetical protein